MRYAENRYDQQLTTIRNIVEYKEQIAVYCQGFFEYQVLLNQFSPYGIGEWEGGFEGEGYYGLDEKHKYAFAKVSPFGNHEMNTYEFNEFLNFIDDLNQVHFIQPEQAAFYVNPSVRKFIDREFKSLTFEQALSIIKCTRLSKTQIEILRMLQGVFTNSQYLSCFATVAKQDIYIDAEKWKRNVFKEEVSVMGMANPDQDKITLPRINLHFTLNDVEYKLDETDHPTYIAAEVNCRSDQVEFDPTIGKDRIKDYLSPILLDLRDKFHGWFRLEPKLIKFAYALYETAGYTPRDLHKKVVRYGKRKTPILFIGTDVSNDIVPELAGEITDLYKIVEPNLETILQF